jgi:hypothetical protein
VIIIHALVSILTPLPTQPYTYPSMNTHSISLAHNHSLFLSHAVFFSTISMAQTTTVQPMAQSESSISFSNSLSGADSQTLNHSSKPHSITCSHCNFRVGISPYKLIAMIETNKSTGAMELLDSFIPCTMLTTCWVTRDIKVHWIERLMWYGRGVC